MTDKELINKIKTLKQISPSKEWVSLSKMQILENKPVKDSPAKANFLSIFNTHIFNAKLAYSLAVLFIIMVGVAGVLQYGFPLDSFMVKSNNGLVSPAARTAIKNDVENLKEKSKNLAAVMGEKSEDAFVEEREKEVKEAAKTVAESIKKDPDLAKVVALDVNNSRTILDIPGGDEEVKAASDDVYKAIVDPIIASIKKTKLNTDQKLAFENIMRLYENKNYSDALVGLLIGFSKESKDVSEVSK